LKNKLLPYYLLKHSSPKHYCLMTKKTAIALCLIISVTAIVIACNQPISASVSTGESMADSISAGTQYGGFESQLKWGEHLVIIGGCNDCHTPKKMGPKGPEDDMSLMLSGHPAQMPPAAFDQKEAGRKGLVITQTFTSWVGPWGITYAANLTSDSTGIGMWKEEQFVKALKEKKWMGLENTRPLMPPMSMMPATKMSDDEMKAIFAYLKSTPPIKNVPPNALLVPPPAGGTQ
jgi:cytochrome c553